MLNVLVLLVFLILLLSFLAFLVGFYSPIKNQNDPHNIPKVGSYSKYYDKMNTLIDNLLTTEFEGVSITSKDGKRLFGKFYKGKTKPQVVQLMLHGYRGCAERDFCGGFEMGQKTGFSTLLIDQRACSKSQGHTVTMGIKEAQDAVSWMNWINQTIGSDTKILVYGVSMGAASALMALNLNIPENVVGIIADSPYTSPKAIIQSVAKAAHLNPALSYPFARLGARLFGSFDTEQNSAIEGVKHSTVPILIIHGRADTFVPCTMGEELFKASVSPTKQLLLVDNADHALSFMVDYPTYQKTVTAFLTELGLLKSLE